MPQTPEFFRQQMENARLRRNDVQTARAVAQTELNRQVAQLAINNLLKRTCDLAHLIAETRQQLELKNAILDAWRDKHPIFTESALTPAHYLVSAIFLLGIYIAALGLDIFLLSGNARLIAKDFANNVQALVYLTMVAVPLFILMFEAYFQTQWSTAETRGQRWLWGTLSVLMCLAIPATIIGLSISTNASPSGAKSLQVQNWHIIGKAVLALFVHAGVLLGGDRLHETKMYAIFKLKEKWQTRGINRAERKSQQAETDLTNNFTNYFQQLNSFNTTHPQNTIEPGPFDEITRNQINRVFGYEIIAAPPAQNTANNQPNNNQNNGNGGANTPPPIDPNTNNQPNGNGFTFNMDGEDEVRP